MHCFRPAHLNTDLVSLHAEVPDPLSGKSNQDPLYILSNDVVTKHQYYYGLSTSPANGSKPLSLFHVSGGNLIGFKTQYPKKQPFQTFTIFNNSLIRFEPHFTKHPPNELLSLTAAPGSVNGDECYLNYNGSSDKFALCPNNAGDTVAHFIAYFATSPPVGICNATKIMATKA